jgi:hypothetical protein
MIKWSETVMKKKTIALFFALMIMASGTGCQKIRKIFVKPPPEGVVESSYPVTIYAYQSSVVVKASPQEIIEYFVKDPSWLEKASGTLQLEFKDLRPGIVTEVGQSIDLNIRLLGLNFPCRMININYKPDKELWLMILTDGNWILVRFELKPIPEGSMVNLNLLGQPSKTLGAILDVFELGEAAGSRIDLIMAFVQAEFDPELDVKELTGKGLRGEDYEAFFQAHEASVRVDADPENVAQWIVNHLDSSMPEIKLKGDCSSYKVFAELSEDEVRHCPASLEFVKVKVDIDTFLTWRTEGKERIYRVYLQGLDRIGFYQLEVGPEARGSRVKCMVMTDIPGAASARMMDIMMAFVAMPKRVRELLLDIKQGVEGIG